MTYEEHAPSPVLAPFVRCIWSMRSDRSAAAARMQRVLPDGCMDVIFSFGDEPVGSFSLPDERARVVGSMTQADRFLLLPGTDLLGVRFRPGAAGSFLRLAAHEIVNSSAPLLDIWGPSVSPLQHELAHAPVERRRERLARELMRRLAEPTREQRAVIEAQRAIGRCGGRVSVDAIAEHIGVSRRQLERAFATFVGHGPKVACRVARLASTLRIADARPTISQSQLAIEGGYFDQAHMIREVRALSGATPRELIAERSGVAFVQSECEEGE